MNTMPINTNSLFSISECWLFQNHSYVYMKNGTRCSLLPSVSAEYKEILENLYIPHRPLDNSGLKYEFWSANCYSETMVTLPLYIGMQKSYRYIKNYTGPVVTEETINAALNLYKEVIQPEITRRKEEKERQKMVSCLKRFLNNEPACGVCDYWDPLLKVPTEELDLVIGEDHFKVFRVCTLMSEKRQARFRAGYWNYCGVEYDTSPTYQLSTNYLAVFDMNKCIPGATIDMLVPAGAEGIFVGRQGWQVKDWARKLGGLQKINVKKRA